MVVVGVTGASANAELEPVGISVVAFRIKLFSGQDIPQIDRLLVSRNTH